RVPGGEPGRPVHVDAVRPRAAAQRHHRRPARQGRSVHAGRPGHPGGLLTVRWFVSVAALLLLAGVFGSSAGAKLITRRSFRQFRNSLPDTLGVPLAQAGRLAVASVAAEALLAAGLV